MRSFPIFTNLIILILLFLNFIDITVSENVKKSVDDNPEDNGELNDDANESMAIPLDTETPNATCTRRQNSQMHEIRSATYKQFPFIAAIMSQNDGYLCSGSIVARGLILTSAKCAQKPINYVLVNTTSDKKDDAPIQLHITKSEIFPTYTGSESSKDVAIIYTEKHNKSIASKINLSNITDVKGINDLEALGFGLNSDLGKTKELQYIGVELRYSNTDKSQAFIDCIETKVPTCFKDYGGPVIYDNQLFGIVVEGSSDCVKELTANYAVHKHILDFIPAFTFKAWLEDKIRNIEEKEPIVLETYPSQPILRQTPHVMTGIGQGHRILISIHSLIFVSVLLLVNTVPYYIQC